VKTFLHFEKGYHPRPGGIERDTFPEELVATFLRRYTVEGETVLDPFAGFGTTLVVAERMGRKAIGIEFLDDRAEYIRGRTSQTVIHGDSRRIDELGLPLADLSITSPPYMHRNDVEDPLQGYTVPGSGYDAYLSGLRDIYRRMRYVVKPDGVIVVNVSNIKRHDGVTLLAWDVANALSEVLALEGETVICWDDTDEAFGYDHEYCLVFRNR